MDPLNIVRADGGSLLPIVIFVIYIIFTVIGASQKKKKKQMLEERRRREAVSAPETAPDSYDKPEERPYTPQPEQSDAGDVMGEIKRELETILGKREKEEEYLPVEKEPEPLDTEPVSYQTYDAQAASSPVTMVVAAPEANPAAVSITTLPALSAFSYDESALYDHDQKAAVAVDLASLDEARKGMVWSEILGPCKALRDT